MAGPVSEEYLDKQAVPEIEKRTEARPAEWEAERNDKNPLKSEKDVTEKDKFLLGRNLIFWVLICYVIIGSINCMFGDVKGVEIVWQNASVFFQSILTLLIGYYFGTKQVT
jgi:hypothetical protein